jgi:hypothetical protein
MAGEKLASLVTPLAVGDVCLTSPQSLGQFCRVALRAPGAQWGCVQLARIGG